VYLELLIVWALFLFLKLELLRDFVCPALKSRIYSFDVDTRVRPMSPAG
jgi:hypothetical protein